VFPEGIGQPFHLDFLTFAEVAKTIKMYWLLTSEPPFRRGLAE